MKKLSLLIIISILSFITFLLILYRPRSYELTYKVDEYQVKESYYLEDKYYLFVVKKDNYTYEFIKEIKYTSNRGLIKELKELTEEDYNCIIPILNDTDVYPICYQNKELISWDLIDKELYPTNIKTLNEEYKGINIYALNKQTYLIYNYKGFYYINENTKKEITLFNQDIYAIPLATIINNYLFIPNYEQSHTFKSAYVINMLNGHKELWTLDEEINFNSYILGSYDESIYLFDNKTKKEYELVPHKKKMRIVSKNKEGIIYNNGWENISVNKLADKEYKFNFSSKYSYEVRDSKLFLSIKGSKFYTRVSNIENMQIIYTYNDTVYYWQEDKLYCYNPYIGELLLMEYFEWNFNQQIFIFNNQNIE